MFKRRKPRSYSQIATEMIYPRGGWRRATWYTWHRLRRLPDQPHRIGRGVAAGVFVSFTPLFGFHFASAIAVAWVIGGNFLAAAIGSFIGNPVTFPFIAMLSVGLGRHILGIEGQLTPHVILGEFSRAGAEMWHNLTSLFGPETAHWAHLQDFFTHIWWPYMVGGLVPGLIVAVICHYLTVPVIVAYHRRRAKKMAARIARLRHGTPHLGPRPTEEMNDD